MRRNRHGQPVLRRGTVPAGASRRPRLEHLEERHAVGSLLTNYLGFDALGIVQGLLTQRLDDAQVSDGQQAGPTAGQPTAPPSETTADRSPRLSPQGEAPSEWRQALDATPAVPDWRGEPSPIYVLNSLTAALDDGELAPAGATPPTRTPPPPEDAPAARISGGGPAAQCAGIDAASPSHVPAVPAQQGEKGPIDQLAAMLATPAPRAAAPTGAPAARTVTATIAPATRAFSPGSASPTPLARAEPTPPAPAARQSESLRIGFNHTDLAGWTTEVVGGSEAGRGSVRTGSAWLREGDSFLVGLERAFVVPEHPAPVVFTYTDLHFDTSDPDSINDAFEASLVGADGKPLVHGYAARRDAYFNVTEDVGLTTGPGAAQSGDAVKTVTLDVSGVLPGTVATLRFRLVNNDQDTGTEVHILDVIVPSSNRPPELPPLADRKATAGTALEVVAPFSDPDVQDTHTATIEWGDGTTGPATVTEATGQGTATASHHFARPGEYTARLTVTDALGASAFRDFVVRVAAAGGPALAFVIDDPATPGLDALLADDAPAGTPTALGPTTHADSLAAPGVVGYQGRLGAYPFVTVTAMQQSLPGMAVADMHLAVNALSGAAGTLTVQATLGGLQAPAPGTYTLSSPLGGIASGSVAFEEVVDLADRPFAPVRDENTYTTGLRGPFGPGPYSDTREISVPFAGPGSFSLTKKVTLTSTGPGQLNGAHAGGVVRAAAGPADGTKFFVADPQADRAFRYGPAGAATGSFALGGVTNARGVASNAAGDMVWVIDGTTHEVMVRGPDGSPRGSWRALGLDRPEGITTDGTDVWVVDAGARQVLRYAGAAALRSGEASPAGRFGLHVDNASPSDVVTDGQVLWVTDDGTDEVFVYEAAGALLGRWRLDDANADTSGITRDPTGASNDLWVVDRADRVVYAYAGGTAWRDGSRAATSMFALAAGNVQPEGIADPPAPGDVPSASGTDFWLAFPSNLDQYSYEEVTPLQVLYLTAAAATTARVEVPGLGFVTEVAVAPGAASVVPLPAEVEVTTDDGIVNKGIHVTAQAPVTVTGLSTWEYSSDSFLGLPTSALGTEYLALGYGYHLDNPEAGTHMGGELVTVVATQDDTHVTLTTTGVAIATSTVDARMTSPDGSPAFTVPGNFADGLDLGTGSIPVAYGDVGPMFLQQSGTYTMTVAAPEATRSGTYRFRWLDPETDAIPLALGQVAEGHLDRPGYASPMYTFEGTAGQVLWLDNQSDHSPGALNLYSGQDGGRVTHFIGRTDYQFTLPITGRYYLGFQEFLNIGQHYRFRLLDLATAATLPFDTPVSGQLETGRETQLYQFHGEAGQHFLYDSLGASTANLRVKVFANGVYGGTPVYDQPVQNDVLFSLPATGTYHVAVESLGYGWGLELQTPPGAEYRFRLVNGATAPPLVLNGTTNGHLDALRQGLHVFDVTEPLALHIDASSTAGLPLLELRGPAVQVLGGGPGELWAHLFRPGRYVLAVNPNADVPADYTLTTTATAFAKTPLSGFGTVEELTIAAGESATYSFSAPAGTLVMVDNLTTGSEGLQMALVDPDGGLLPGATGASDINPVRLPLSGDYQLRLTNTGAAEETYRFQVLDLESHSPPALFGDTFAGTLQPRQTAIYAFPGQADHRAYFDLLQEASSELSFTWLTPRPGETPLADGKAVDVLETAPHYLLVQSVASGPVDYRFRLFDLTAAPKLPIDGTTAAGTLATEFDTAVYRLTSRPGLRLHHDALSSESTFEIHLLSWDFQPVDVHQSDGTLAQVSSLPSDIDLSQLHLHAGTYYLAVSKAADAVMSGPIDYQVRLVDIDQAPALPIGTAVRASLETGLESALYTIDVTGHQTLTLTPLDVPAGVSGTWSIRDQKGWEIASGGLDGPLTATLERGWYTLFVTTTQAGPVELLFRADVAFPPAVPVSGFGTVHEASLAPGETKTFSFTAPAGRMVYFDTTYSRFYNAPYEVTLNRGEVYQLRVPVPPGGLARDLTGSILTSDKPVAVFAGNDRAAVPMGTAAVDTLVEQLPPVESWAREYVAAPLAERVFGDTYRVLAAEDGTVVWFNGVEAARLNRGDFLERMVQGPLHVTASHPVLVAQFAHGSALDRFGGKGEYVGDPFMSLVPAVDQYVTRATVAVPATDFPAGVLNLSSRYLNVTAPAAAVGQVYLDGAAIAADQFHPVGAGAYAYAQLAVTGGAHTVTSPVPVGVTVYGFGKDNSHGSPAGMSIVLHADPTVEVLTPNNGSVAGAGSTLLVAGRALPGSPEVPIVLVTVNGTAVDAFDAAGNFFARVPVALGANAYTVVATDARGQTATATAGVTGELAADGLDFSLFSDVTGSLTAEYGRTSYNADRTLLYADLAVRNTGTYATAAPLLVGVTHLSDATVRVRDADGTTPDGTPYYDLSSQVVDGMLAPGAATGARTISFANPTGERFTYDLVFLGQLNRAPAITSVPDVEALAGRAYSYDVDASDPDADAVGFSLVAAPAGMAIDAQTGVITWTPAAAQVGQHSVAVRVEDGRGGSTEQRYNLAAVEPPPNRPPVFTSVPVVDAIVGKPYAYDAVARDEDGDRLTYSLARGPEGIAIDPQSGAIAWAPREGSSNLLVNGGFEEPVVGAGGFLDVGAGESRITGWDVLDGTVDVTSGAGEWGEAYEQNQWLDLVGYSNGRISQTFSTQVGNSYRLRFWYANNGRVPSGSGIVQVIGDSGPLLQEDFAHSGSQPPDQMGWQLFTGAFHADSATTTLVFQSTTPDATSSLGGIALDAVSVVDVTGNPVVTIQVADGRGGVATQTYQVRVSPDPDNRQPLITSAPATLAVVNSGYSYQVEALDPNQDALTFTLLSGPGGMTMRQETGLVSWSPAASDVGTHDVTVRVEDGRGGSDTQSFSVTVTDSTGEIRGSVFNDVNGNGQWDGMLSFLLGDQFNGVTRFDARTGELIEKIISEGSGGLDGTTAVVQGPDGNLYVGSYNTNQVLRYAVDGSFLDVFASGNGLDGPWGMVFGPDGNLYVASRRGAQVLRYDGATGDFIDVFATGDALTDPTSLDFGPDGNLYVVNVFGSKDLVRFDGDSGEYLGVVVPTYWGNAAVGFAFAPNGDLYQAENLADSLEHIDGTTFELIESIPVEHGGGSVQFIVFGPDNQLYLSRHLTRDVLRFDPESRTFSTFISSADNDLDVPSWVTFVEEGESPLANWTVYIDQNQNGHRDPGERYTTTGPHGEYSFLGLAPANYTVAMEGQPGWRQTAPAGGTHVVALAGGQVVTDMDFGNVAAASTENRRPQIHSAPPTVAAAGSPFRYAVNASDLDGDALTFDLPVRPDGMAVDPARGVIVWTPARDQVGTHDVTLRVRDPHGELDLQSFRVEVTQPNTAPIITSTPPSFFADPFRYAVRTQDVDGDVLTYRLEGGLGLTIDPVTGVITGAPSSNEVASGRVIVTDGRGGEAAQSFSLVVRGHQAVNRAPVLRAEPGTATVTGTCYIYQPSATDEDGDPLSYTLPTAASGMTVNADGLVSWVPTAAQVGSHNVVLRVSDGQGGITEKAFTLAVAAAGANQAPVIVSNPPPDVTLGATYRYDARALDPEGNQVVWALEAAPPGMSINAQTGTITWAPSADQIGNHAVVVVSTDTEGSSSAQPYTLAVRGLNRPPQITSAPSTVAAVGAPYAYSVRATDPDGDRLLYSLVGPPTMSIDRSTGLLRWVPGAADVGVHEVQVTVSDGQSTATQSFDLEVQGAAANRFPVITSAPPGAVTLGQPYTYAVTASDPDGDPVSYRLDVAPTGMAIDADSGALTWTPSPTQTGPQNVVIVASDGRGGAGTQSFTLTPRGNTPPVISSALPATATPGAAYRYDVRATDADGDRLTYELTTAPAGMTIDSNGRVHWAPEAGQTGTVAVALRVSDGRGGAATQQGTITLIADTTAPQVAIQVSANPAPVGRPLTIAVSATDNIGVAALALTVGGAPVTLDANGVATITPPAVGPLALAATARDAAGNKGTANVSVSVIDPNDVDGPVVELTSPDDNGVLTAPTEVRGTVTDATLVSYTLSVAPVGSDAFVEIARGSSAVTNGVLGKLDTSTLANDSYVLRLFAVDGGGNEATVERLFSVAGELKLGNFTVSFTDISVPVSGVPITVSRTYDSLNAGSHDELGFGWRLEYRDTDLRTSVAPTGLEDDGIYNPFQDGTRVYVTLPGGRREGFTFRPQRAPGLRGSFLGIYHPGFVADAGVYSTLTVDTFDLSRTTTGYASYGGDMAYNPVSGEFGGAFTLTTKDGLAYRINGTTGDVETVTDANGNTLTFSDEAIVSSAGPRVTFERTPQGQISAVIDPAGNRVRYGYDLRGDLVSVTDRDGHVTRFVYGEPRRPHYLTEVIDPLGRSGVRTEYDAQGRLVQLIDAQGKTVQLAHDPLHSTETVRDQLGNPTVYEYDGRGNVVKEVNAEGGVTERTYDANNNTLTETVVLGDGTRLTKAFTYDDSGNVLTETDPLGHVTRTTYAPFSQVATTTDALGNTTTNEYDGNGNLLRTTDPAGVVTTFTYDAAGNPTALTHGGGTTTFVYDGAGRVARQVDALGTARAYTYDANGNQLTATTTQTTPTGVRMLVTSTEYDASGRVTKVTDAEGGVTRTEYDAAGNKVATIDPLGRRAEYRYDERGKLTETIFPDGTRARAEYDAAGREVASIDEEGRRTESRYDRVGRLVETIYPDATPLTLADNPRTRTEYDAAGRAVAQIDERGNRTEYTFDAAGRQTKVRDALGNETVRTFDAAGRQVAVTDALGHTTRFTLDASGRQVEVLFADGTKTQSGYDGAGRLTSRTDQLGRVTRYEYDAAGRLTAVVDALSQRTEYGYDEAGNLLTEKDAQGRVTRHEYDGLNRRTATVLPLGQRSTVSYDAVGHAVSTTDFNGATITYRYDERDRVVARTVPLGATVAFTYTPTGERETVTDGRGVTRWAYDERGRLLSRTDPDGTAIAYTYDPAGNRTSLTTPAGTTTYTFDALNRTATVTDPDLGVTRYTYDAVGNQVRMELANGTTETRSYDDLNRLLFVENTGPGGVISSARYTLAATGRRDVLLEQDGRRVEYGYDALDRLTRETITDAVFGDRAIDYTYDAVGNRLTRVDTAEGVTEYTYDANDRLLTESLAGVLTQYGYDSNGNTLSKVSPTDRVFYQWDFENRLVGADTNGDGAVDVTNVYDADGIRVAQTVGGQETRFLIDAVQPYQQVALEYRPSGLVVASYVYGNDLISQARGGARTFYHVDGLGSTRALTGASGAVTDRYVYDAFGRMIRQSGGTANVYLFAGEQRDGALGLDYLRARYLTPSTGRFASRDSFPSRPRNPTTLHRFLYANADAVNSIDPTGNETINGLAVAISSQNTLVRIASFARTIQNFVNKAEGLRFALMLVRFADAYFTALVDGVDVQYSVKGPFKGGDIQITGKAIFGIVERKYSLEVEYQLPTSVIPGTNATTKGLGRKVGGNVEFTFDAFTNALISSTYGISAGLTLLEVPDVFQITAKLGVSAQYSQGATPQATLTLEGEVTKVFAARLTFQLPFFDLEERKAGYPPLP